MSGEWTRGSLTIERQALEEIRAHALAEYPSECCGFVFGPSGDPPLLTRAQRESNEADKYHRLDPERFPRTSRTYFKMNELRAAKAFDANPAEPVKVIYHSHCDAGAYFSAEDAATFAHEGQLMWPCAFLVVSVRDGVLAGERLWVHRPGTNEFDESTLAIRD
jgi:[CysO sulfur-carrier protein]-S-L-cysteine hydrolase